MGECEPVSGLPGRCASGESLLLSVALRFQVEAPCLLSGSGQTSLRLVALPCGGLQ